MAYELDRITPFNAGNAFYDFRVIGENEEKLSILIIAVKADIIQPYIDALREKGIAVSRVTANLTGIDTLCRFAGLKRDVIFLELSGDGYEGALFQKNSIANIVVGSFPTDDERSQADLIIWMRTKTQLHLSHYAIPNGEGFTAHPIAFNQHCHCEMARHLRGEL